MAVIGTVVDARTANVVIANTGDAVEPIGTVTDDGTSATAGLPLLNATVMVAAAEPSNVTWLDATGFPPTAEVADTVSDRSAGAWTVKSAVRL